MTCDVVCRFNGNVFFYGEGGRGPPVDPLPGGPRPPSPGDPRRRSSFPWERFFRRFHRFFSSFFFCVTLFVVVVVVAVVVVVVVVVVAACRGAVCITNGRHRS